MIMLSVVVPQVALAQPGATQTPPVAVISLVWGVVTLKHQTADYQPAVWLDPIFPGDQVKTAGPGSKLLITFFFDNHQEVLGPDSEAQVGGATLTTISGGAIRKDKARNPFGSGGVQNPFVYTHFLVTGDFTGADAPDALQRENACLQATARTASPLAFTWPAADAVGQYQLQILNATAQTVVSVDSKTNRYELTPKQAMPLYTGTVYSWQVSAPSNPRVVAPYSFMYLSRPQDNWLTETRDYFEGLRKRGQLQRSNYTDYVLVCAQLVRVDDVIALCTEMASMNPNNSRVFRALTRAYLMKNCPLHARQAHDQELKLGGMDTVYP
jgi:hypothetical protein